MSMILFVNSFKISRPLTVSSEQIFHRQNPNRRSSQAVLRQRHAIIHSRLVTCFPSCQGSGSCAGCSLPTHALRLFCCLLFQRAPVDAFCIVLLRLSCSVRPILPRKDLVPNRSNACFGQVFNLEIHSNTEQSTICHTRATKVF